MRPQYIIKIDGGYFNRAAAWRTVAKESATRLSHKEAYRVRGKLKRLGYTVTVELDK